MISSVWNHTRRSLRNAFPLLLLLCSVVLLTATLYFGRLPAFPATVFASQLIYNTPLPGWTPNSLLPATAAPQPPTHVQPKPKWVIEPPTQVPTQPPAVAPGPAQAAPAPKPQPAKVVPPTLALPAQPPAAAQPTATVAPPAEVVQPTAVPTEPPAEVVQPTQPPPPPPEQVAPVQPAVAPPVIPGDKAEPGSSEVVIDNALLIDQILVYVSYVWLCCGVLLFIMIPVAFLALYIWGAKRRKSLLDQG
jgi:hypothetical protein